MSKQLKLKFKKILKKAEFVHADLEYHKELIGEAKQMFSDAITETLKNLSAEDQEKIKQISEKRTQEAFDSAAAAASAAEDTEEPVESLEDCRALVATGIVVEAEEPVAEKKPVKSAELKRLFYRIAEQTHPDKVRASGFSESEVWRLERIFRCAQSAYKEENWYVLYSIAVELDIKTIAPTEEHIQWVEDDIRVTLGAIAQIGNFVAWHWYVGNAQEKLLALQDYFRQAYGVILNKT